MDELSLWTREQLEAKLYKLIEATSKLTATDAAYIAYTMSRVDPEHFFTQSWLRLKAYANTLSGQPAFYDEYLNAKHLGE